ncbi:MAG: hypothetical protein P4L50_05580 [Anaerolineaceae bacterium]|nr:hypothetical protein [Anaerolineaceae bacterium]
MDDKPFYTSESAKNEFQGLPEVLPQTGDQTEPEMRSETQPSEFKDDQTEKAAEPGPHAAASARPAADVLKDAWEKVGTVGQALGSALQSRGNVVMVRVNDEALRHLDMLVDAEITKSRSESAALLINEGIKANPALFDRISDVTQKIAALRSELRQSVKMNPE